MVYSGPVRAGGASVDCMHYTGGGNMEVKEYLWYCRKTRWRYLYPPCGREVRRLISVLTLAVGLPRLPFVHNVFSFAPQRFGEPEVFGVLCTIIGLLLFVTSYKWRLTLFGRLVAVFGFVTWITLAVATISATSLLIDLALAMSLLWEIGTLHE